MSTTENFAKMLLERGSSSVEPDGVALIHEGQSTTYAALGAAVTRTSRELMAAGLEPGDRVALLAENSVAAFVVYLGCMHAEGVAVPLAPSSSSAMLDAQLAATEARFAVAAPSCVDQLLSLEPARELTCVWRATEDALALEVVRRGVHGATRADPAADGLAALMFTSGSTGAPRGVMVSHGNLIANTRAIVRTLWLGATDRAMLVLPYYYCYGASVLHSHLYVGGSVVLGPKLSFPELMLDALEESAATGLYGVPSTYTLLLRRSTLGQRRFSRLRYLAQAGGRLAEPFLRELLECAHPFDVHVMYGQTEATARLAHLGPRELRQRLGSIGKAVPGTTLSVLTGEGLPVRPDEVGEVVARGPGVTGGYWRDRDATRQRFRDGALYTGDLAVVDDDGFIYIHGRCSDFLKVAGVRVSAREVEDVISSMPGVEEVAVVGEPDDVLGEAVVAHVVPMLGHMLTAYHVIAHCRAELQLEKVPRRVVVRDSLPKTASGKVALALLAGG